MFMYRGLMSMEICLGEPGRCTPSNKISTSTLPGATPRHFAVNVPSSAGPTKTPPAKTPWSINLARLSGLTLSTRREGSSTMATLPSSSSGVTITGKSTRAAAPSSVPYPENDARVAAVRPVFCSNALLSALSLPALPTTCVTFVFTMLPVEISRVSYVWFKRSLATVVPACATRKDTAYVPSVSTRRRRRRPRKARTRR
mmetsp:Transcript_11580/g.49386  ORF Transcript_11580/g.49386 Transcript_11580/m.49386 type:complete len:200 (-) Transcript_11580:6171-6770(-)